MTASVRDLASIVIVALLLSAIACNESRDESVPLAVTEAPAPTIVPPIPADTPYPPVTPPRFPPTPTPIRPPTVAPAPTPTSMPYHNLTAAETASLAEYAASVAGGPGAIYVGDLNQLSGPAPVGAALLDSVEINVTLDSLERHRWLYESGLYQNLLRKARLTDPTPLTSSGEEIVIKHACAYRESPSCRLLENFFAPNLSERTGGQIRFEVITFHELEVSHEYSASPVYALELLSDGIPDSATVHSYYVTDNIPLLRVPQLWGLHLSREHQFLVNEAILSHVENSVQAEPAERFSIIAGIPE